MLPVACGKRISNTRESLGNIVKSLKYRDFPLLKFNFPHTKSNFPHTKSNFSQSAFCFFQRPSNFFNGFPIFLNGFPLSEKSGKIYLWGQVYKRSLSELRISAKNAIFCNKLIGGKNTKDCFLSFVFSAPSFVILAN
jgi:hypothetical protein